MRITLSVAICAAALMAASAFGAGPAKAASTKAEVTPSLLMVRIYVADMARSERFYEQALNMRLVAKLSDHEHVLMFPGAPGPGVIILQGDPLVPQANGSFVIRVPDVDAAVARAAAQGARILRAPAAGPEAGTRDAVLNDYDGTVVEIASIAGP